MHNADVYCKNYPKKDGKEMDSVWTESMEQGAERIGFEPLTGNVATDVLIIGGGMAGILCAYMLKDAGADVTLVAADRICSGVTKKHDGEDHGAARTYI